MAYYCTFMYEKDAARLSTLAREGADPERANKTQARNERFPYILWKTFPLLDMADMVGKGESCGNRIVENIKLLINELSFS